MDLAAVLGELVGTFVLVFLGTSVNAGVSLKKVYGEGAGWIAITVGWGLAVFAGVAVAAAMGDLDGHLNPAVTLASVLMTGHAWRLAYLPAQLVGAFLGAAATWLFYMPHWELTPDAGTKLGVFATGPAVRRLPWNFLAEVMATFVLVLVATALFSKRVAPGGLAPGLGPVLVGSLVWAIGLSLGGVTGYAINPARDLGPRLAHAVLPVAGKGGSDWSYAWVPVVAPMVGAALAAGFIVAVKMT